MKNRIITASLIITMTINVMGCGANVSENSSELEDQMESNVATEEDTEENAETEQTADQEIDNIQLYKDVLDMFYYNIDTAVWDQTEEVSELFYSAYTDVQSLADAGYAFGDLDGNGVDELLVTSMKGAERGIIYDLYTCQNGEVVHLATGGERWTYYLCEDNTIYQNGSGGALLTSWEKDVVDSNEGSLRLMEIVLYDGYTDEENPWNYGISDCYEEESGYDLERMDKITEEEAYAITDAYQSQVVSFQLNSFEMYTPSGQLSAEDMLKVAFHSAIDSTEKSYFLCDDFDADGNLEGFGIAGNDNGWDLENAKVYIVDRNGNVLCIDEFENLYGYGGGYVDADNFAEYNVIDTGSQKFLSLGGMEGQKTWLYGVKNGQAYQPEISGQHDCFSKFADGLYCGQPNEGGPGYYQLYYEYDADSGEFVPTN
ncbi:MAG: hypothetical protein ACI4DO_08420 [Roseburia sp.]